MLLPEAQTYAISTICMYDAKPCYSSSYTTLHILLLATIQVEEADIRAWANRKARQQGCAVQLASFRDPALADGVFILHCVHAVYPHPSFGLRIALHSNSFPPRCRDPPPDLWPSG